MSKAISRDGGDGEREECGGVFHLVELLQVGD
jgi:hypothetical protein